MSATATPNYSNLCCSQSLGLEWKTKENVTSNRRLSRKFSVIEPFKSLVKSVKVNRLRLIQSDQTLTPESRKALLKIKRGTILSRTFSLTNWHPKQGKVLLVRGDHCSPHSCKSVCTQKNQIMALHSVETSRHVREASRRREWPRRLRLREEVTSKKS